MPRPRDTSRSEFAPRKRGADREVGAAQVDRKSLLIARILGARQISKALLAGIDPSPQVLAMGVWGDLTHAASARPGGSGIGTVPQPD